MLNGVSRKTMKEALNRLEIWPNILSRRLKAMWDIPMATEQEARQLVGSILTEKNSLFPDRIYGHSKDKNHRTWGDREYYRGRNEVLFRPIRTSRWRLSNNKYSGIFSSGNNNSQELFRNPQLSYVPGKKHSCGFKGDGWGMTSEMCTGSPGQSFEILVPRRFPTSLSR